MNPDSHQSFDLAELDPGSDRPDSLAADSSISIESELRLAADPTTASDQLIKLAYTNDRRILERIAGNPNAPTELLLQLGAEFPEQLLNNPILPLLCLEQVNQVNKIPLKTLCRLLKQPNIPEHFFELGVKSQNWEAITCLGMNPQTPKAILERLVQTTWNPEFQQVAKLHVNWKGEISEGWEEIARQEIEKLFKSHHHIDYLQEFKRIWEISQVGPTSLPDCVIEQQAIAADPETPRRLLESLSSSKHFEIRLAVAANPSTQSEILAQLAEEQNEWIHQAIAENPNTTPGVLTQLATDSEQSVAVLEAITRHPETPLTILEQLISSQYPTVTQGAIENLYWETNLDPKWKTLYQNRLVSSSPDLPSHLWQKLEKMVVNPDHEIRSKIAAHPKTPPQILYKLAHDPDIEVRLALVNNPQIPATILGELICHESGVLPPTDSELQSSSLLQEILKISPANWWIQTEIAGNPNTPRRLLRKLANHYDPGIRGTVAANSHTPPDCLLKLAQDRDKSVQRKVHHNPHVPLKALQLSLQKIRSGQNSTQWYKPYEQSLCQEDLNKFFEIAPPYLKRFPEDGPLVFVESCLNSTTSLNLRLLALCYPEISATALVNFSSSAYWIERYCIAQHPNTPIPSLERLAQDGNRIVRAAAKASAGLRKNMISYNGMSGKSPMPLACR